MSVNNIPLIVNTDTFGIWKDRTNSVIDALEDVVSLGDVDSSNANGNVVINGYVKSYQGILTDTVTPISGSSGTVALEGAVTTSGDLTVNNGAPGETKIDIQDNGTDTWRIVTTTDHAAIDIETADSSKIFRIDTVSNKITATGLTVDEAIIPGLAASKITSGTFVSARIPSLAASKITSGIFGVARIPDLPASKITAGNFTGDYNITAGSLSIDNNNDGSVMFTLTDNSTISNVKTMMRLDGSGTDLDILNYNDTGDYEFRAGDNAIRLNDLQKGIQFFHRNPGDTNGFDAAFGDSFPDSAPLEINSNNGNQVNIESFATFKSNKTIYIDDVAGRTGERFAGNGSVPTGAVMPFLRRFINGNPGQNAPVGWLYLDGSTIPNGSGTVQNQTADFSELFGFLVALGMPGDANTRELPDMRGRFARAFDERIGSDTANIGAEQNDSIGPHKHNYESDINGNAIALSSDADNAGSGSGISNNDSDGGFSSETTNTGPGIGTETRPKNIAYMYCIKAY